MESPSPRITAGIRAEQGNNSANNCSEKLCRFSRWLTGTETLHPG